MSSNEEKPCSPSVAAKEEEKLAEISVKDVKNFDVLNDYLSRSGLGRPTVADTPKGLFCLDGFEFIKEAIEANRLTINVLVLKYESYSEDKLAIGKIASRANPSIPVHYAETVRHVSQLSKIMRASDPGVKGGELGGERNDKSNDSQLHNFISKETKLAKDTISKYMIDARYLSDCALDALIDEIRVSKKGSKLPSKDFFESIRTYKIRYMAELEAENLSNAEIEEKVSAIVLRAYDEYKTNKKISAFSEKQEKYHKALDAFVAQLLDDMNNKADDELDKNISMSAAESKEGPVRNIEHTKEEVEKCLLDLAAQMISMPSNETDLDTRIKEYFEIVFNKMAVELGYCKL